MNDPVNVPVTLTCPKCGSPPQREEGLGDDGPVTCSNPDCGAKFGTWGEVKARAVGEVGKQAIAATRAALREGFKGSKYLKWKD